MNQTTVNSSVLANAPAPLASGLPSSQMNSQIAGSNLQAQCYNNDPNALMPVILHELQSIRQVMQTLTAANSEQTNLITTLKREFESHIQAHNSLKNEVTSNSTALSSQHTDICDLQKRVENYETRLSILEGNTRRQDLLINELRSELTKQVSRTMKVNTVFYNIAEKEYETNEEIKEETREETIAKVSEFLINEMKMPQELVQNFKYLKIHRLGNRQNRQKQQRFKKQGEEEDKPPAPRPIIVKFLDSDKELLFKYVKNLDRSKYAVSDQFPYEYQEERLLLKDRMKHDPALKDISAQEKRLIDNQLFVKKKLYVLPEQSKDTAPERYNASDIDWERDPPHITMGPSISEKGSVFQGFRARVRDLQEAQVTLDLIHADLRSQPATHLAYAYRIQSGSRIIEHMDDDREYGASRQILAELREKGCINAMVCVARWYGGQNLGPKRKVLYSQSAKDVLGIR